ncbi:excinuclease [Dyella sp. A6]|uniref:excinuclease n=1 Tax=Dyella aluminiiresistens TaxID=3069105 RepID=UPI002E788AF6|nr:excinuclease [Dyella sp. A6]
MNAKTLGLAALLIATLPTAVLAKDKTVHLAFEHAVQAGMQSGKLDGSVTFYLAGNTPHGRVSVVNDNITTHKKTNAFGKSDQTSCDWAMQSALISLQAAAKAAGANAVTDIVSVQNGQTYSDPKNYECRVGFLMSDVDLKAKLAKVH